MRLSTKLVLGFLIVGLTGIGLVALLASLTTRSEFGQFIFTQYQDSFLAELETYYAEYGTFAGVDQAFPFFGPPPLGRIDPHDRRGEAITLADSNGVVLLPGSRYRPGQQLPPDVLARATPIQVDGTTAGWLLAARDDFRQSQAEGLFLDRINRTLVASGIGAVAVSLLLGVLLARTLTRPIRELTAATHAMAGGRLDQQVPVRSRDELGDLATSFNRMSSDLSRSQKARRQMTADIAHELRTPISIILGHVDALEDGVIPSTSEAFGVIRDEADRLSRLVEDLRTLSHAEAGEMVLMRTPIDPRSLLDRAAVAHRPLAAEKGIELQIDLKEDLPEINVDSDRMAQVLDNLVCNALRHTLEGGQVHLYARWAEDGIELGVHDSGPGIEPEAKPYIFDRFYRPDSSRRRDTGGSGLGLAIARSLVEAHGGTIRAQSGPGEGADFVIHLPTTRNS